MTKEELIKKLETYLEANEKTIKKMQQTNKGLKLEIMKIKHEIIKGEIK